MRTATVPLTRDEGAYGADPRAAAHEDAALVALVCEGDASALTALYSRYGRPCYALARRVLGDETLAQDVVQEVFLAFWNGASRFDPARASFSSYLLSITHHKAVDAVRREVNLRKRRAPEEAVLQEDPASGGVHDEVWGALRRERVRRALQQLPAPQREALALAYFGGYTQREIAGLTGTPLGTVKTRMLAGMRRLRLELDDIAPGAEGALEPGALRQDPS